jgi:hypothetical protein
VISTKPHINILWFCVGRRFRFLPSWRARAHDSCRLHRRAAIYINFAEQPARLQLDNRSLLVEWKLAYMRGYMMQASLAIMGGLFGLVAFGKGCDGGLASRERCFKGVLLIKRGRVDTGLRLLRTALDELRATGSVLGLKLQP